MNGNLNLPAGTAQQRAAEANMALMLQQFRMGVAKDIQKLILNNFDPAESKPARSEEELVNDIAGTAVNHADALMEAIGPVMGVKLKVQPKVEQ